jgi:hypothetical protein
LKLQLHSLSIIASDLMVANNRPSSSDGTSPVVERTNANALAALDWNMCQNEFSLYFTICLSFIVETGAK